MALRRNGTNIETSVCYNGKPLDILKRNGVIVWENWKEAIGNPLNSSNTTLSWSGSSIGGGWSSIIFNDSTVATWTDFHSEYCTATINDYQKIRIKEIKVNAHYNWKEGNFITTCTVQVSQDGSQYFTVASGTRAGTYTIDYESFGIEYVRYISYTMNLQNSSYGADGQTPTYHYTPSVVVSKYDKKGN